MDGSALHEQPELRRELLRSPPPDTPRTFAAHSGFLWTASFNPDESAVMSVGSREVLIWNPANLEILRPPYMGDYVVNAGFHPDGRRYYVVERMGGVLLYDPLADTSRWFRAAEPGEYHDAAFSPDGSQLAIAFNDRVLLWNPAADEPFRELTGHRQGIGSVRFNSDGTRLLTTGWDSTARIWDVATGAQLRSMAGASTLRWSANFSPDGSRVILGGDDGAYVRDAATGNLLLALGGGDANVADASFSADGRWIVTCGGDRTAKIWNASTGTLYRVLEGHEKGLTSVAFSSNGNTLVTTGLDGMVKIWDME